MPFGFQKDSQQPPSEPAQSESAPAKSQTAKTPAVDVTELGNVAAIRQLAKKKRPWGKVVLVIGLLALAGAITLFITQHDPHDSSSATDETDGGLALIGPSGRLAVPDQTKQVEVASRIAEEYADLSIDAALDAVRTEDLTTAEKYALLDRARQRALTQRDIARALNVVDEMAQQFEVAPMPAKADIVVQLLTTAETPREYQQLGRHAYRLLDKAVVFGEVDAARRLAAAATECAQRTGDSALTRNAEIALLKAEEQASATSPRQQVELGDRWWRVSETADKFNRRQFRGHAARWYRKAVTLLHGENKQRVEQRLAEVFVESAPSAMFLADMELHEVDVNLPSGHTLRSPARVKGSRVEHGLFAPPKSFLSSHLGYRLHKVFEKLRGEAALCDGQREGTANPLTFRIVGDGKLLWTSRPLQQGGESQPFELDVKGIDRLELFVDCPGYATTAYAVWIDPVVVR